MRDRKDRGTGNASAFPAMVRRATQDDIQGIYRAHVASIRELCPGPYTPEQIRAWTEALSPERYLQGTENLAFYVANDGEGLISGLLILDEEAGELCALYVAPWAVRRGLGRRLTAFAEARFRRRGHKRIRLKSTLNAVSFYEAHGFAQEGRDVHTLPGGETLPCILMVGDIP
jgi:ribosomal protein S18 acetylase RimI-like enzyme